MLPKHFKQGKMSIEGHTNIKLYTYKLAIFVQQLIGNERAKMSKTEMYENVQKVLDEFTSRMTMKRKNQFHGGETPDMADFRAFSVL